MRSGILWVVFIGILPFAPQAAAADLERGKQLYAVCAACHGPDGAGIEALHAPRFGGMEEWYLLRQVQNFKAGARGADPRDEWGTQARTMVLTLPDEQALADVSAYIASLKSPPAPPTITGDVDRGRQLYAVCTACHGADGSGMQVLNAPALAGQSDWYLVRQLRLYKDGLRGTHPLDTFGAQMRPMAMTLPDEQAMRDVVAYINTLKK